MLSLTQINIKEIDIITNITWAENQTAKWEHVHIPVDYTEADPMYGFNIAAPSPEAELGEAATETAFILSIDNLTVGFTLPCNYDGLSELGIITTIIYL